MHNHSQVLHVRADKSSWDTHNLFVAPLRELRQYRALISNIVSRDLKVRYKRSIIGVFWTVLAPLMSMIVLWVVFTHALKVTIPYYGAYLLSGIIAWNLFLQSSQAGIQSVLANAALIKKVRLPRVIFPITTVVNNLVNFGFSFLALLLVMAVSGAPFHWTLVLTPLVLIPMILFCLGWAMACSALSVFFRDLGYILEIGLQALFYLTPILYQAESVPTRFQWILSFNPIAKYIHLFRSVVFSGELPDARVYLVSLGLGLLSFFVGWIVFQRLQRKFLYWI